MTSQKSQDNSTAVKVGQLMAALSVVAVGGFLAWGASRFPVDKGYSILGPHVYPYTVAVFLCIVGAGLAYQAVTGGMRGMGTAEPLNRAGPAGAVWVSAGLVGVALLINLAGFVLAGALLFTFSARGFGSRRPLRDLAIGIALTLPVYWIFTSGLGVSLPSLVNSWI